MTEKLQKHLVALKEKHASLDAAIVAEEGMVYPDAMKIQELKKQKLAVKQEIEQVQKELEA